MNTYLQAQRLLTQIEVELKRLSLWQITPPSAVALASTAPFCIDTMPFTHWLQFIFLVKMQQLLALKMPLPENMAIHPMAEEALLHLPADTRQLSQLILSFDHLINTDLNIRVKY
ncbi:MAG: hypothetical protein ACI86X_000738 [Moritella sp.]|jgi:uncharacterized protein YqcC (DUF446 family)